MGVVGSHVLLVRPIFVCFDADLVFIEGSTISHPEWVLDGTT